jgi:putative membrane protein
MNKKFLRAAGMATACAVLVSALTAGGLPTSGVSASAATPGTSKTETVYVNADALGKVKTITVSDRLHSDTSGATINDYSTLTNIKNVKGTEKPSANGSNLTWTLSGTDLYYQGTSTKNLPVSVDIKYYLDGAEIQPASLAGRSGKFELKLTFKNLDGHSVNIDGAMHTVYTPFICAAAFDLPTKYFSNVTTNFGKVVNDGTNQAVSFASVPGLRESLYMYDTGSVNIPETLDVTADVKNFQLSTIMMLVAPVPDMSALGSTSGLSGLMGKLDELYDAGAQLRDATSQLNAGEQAYASGVSELYAGLQLADSSYAQIAAGVNELSGKTSSLGELVSGASQADAGVAQLLAGLGKLKTSLSTRADASAVAAGTDTYHILDYTDQLYSGASSYAAYADSTAYGMTKAGLKSLKNVIYSTLKQVGMTEPALSAQTSAVYGSAVKGELATLHVQADSALVRTMQASGTAQAQLVSQAAAYINMYDILNETANNASVTDTASFETAMKTVSASPYKYTFDKATVLAMIAGAEAADVTGADTTANETLKATVNALSDAQLAGMWQGVSKNYSGDLNNANLVLSGENYKAGLKKFADTFGDTTSSLYKDGIDPLIAGASQLKAGTAQLSAGASQLTELKSGIDKLAAGVGLFNTQALVPLTSGAQTLYGSTPALTSGTAQLSAGMSKFFDEGLSKLKGTERTNLTDALAVKDEMVKLANNYTTFSGTCDGMTSSVKFILRTDEIKPAAVTASSTTSKTSSSSGAKKNIFQRIADFFTKK